MKSPGYHHSPLIKLRFLSELRKKRYARTMFKSLMLTSMVDMFTLIVIFLLSQNTINNDIIAQSSVQLPQIHAPLSSALQNERKKIIVTLTLQNVRINGQSVLTQTQILQLDTHAVELFKQACAMHILNQNKQQLDIIFQADKNVPMIIIRTLAQGLAQLGYTELEYMMQQQNSSP